MSGEMSAIRVTRKYVPPGTSVKPGEHYNLSRDSRKRGNGLPDFSFYRAPDGREFATEVYGVGRGSQIPAGHEKFAQIKTAVEEYDARQGGAK